MKKKWVFAAVTLVTLALTAACRVWQRGTAFEPDGLLTPGMPASRWLAAAVALAAVGFGLLALWVKRGRSFESYLDAFALPCRSLLAVYCVAGALLVASGVAGLMNWADAAISQKALDILLAPTGLSVALVGWLGGEGQEGRGRFAWPLLVPPFTGCVWLVAVYQARATEPNMVGYCFAFGGAVCAVIGCYAVASFSFEKPMPVWAMGLGGLGIVLLGGQFADAYLAQSYGELFCVAGYLLYLTAQLKCLAVRSDCPPELERWTPHEADESDKEVEVADDE